MQEIEITFIKGGIASKKLDFITEEVPLTIEINKKEIATLLCSPRDLKELSIGFAYTSSLIKDISSVKNIVIDEERWKASLETDLSGLDENIAFKRLYTSGCGKGIIFYSAGDLINRNKLSEGLKVEASKITEAMANFTQSSEEFKKTGGVHSAALCNKEGGVLNFKDDIGRHNAVDKVIGTALLNKINFEDKFVLLSGRISSEIFFKLKKCGISIIASISAPTNQAVKMAKEMNLTLIGFVRGRRMNVYSAEARIVIQAL
ncbi:formate dehydrogenase family accessory protein FdhD [candidate division WOR-1 bacterium RIFOXYA2_FULL_36_21]|nr:MAG: formate dehydrogenase family accessory protein FdhD [candidate division WOR-1 bacterium RIFOXYA2_FULL_36_21]OGC16012.1 MAG: formate dehydrogenase family accessory protein FdhD [candidate division WOR-1 bacterium RIFOXYA12_FULL_36_13]